MARVGVYLILQSETDEIVLIRRSNTGFGDGLLSLPSGKVEYGESLKEAAIREAQEECGIFIRISDLALVHLTHRFKREDDERLDFFFLCNRWSGAPVNREPEKHSEIITCELSKLPHDMIDYHRNGIIAACNNKFSSISFCVENNPQN